MAGPVKDVSNFLFKEPDKNTNPDDKTKDELLLKIIDEVFSKEDIEVKTDLNNQQIVAFSKGKLYSDRFKSPLIGKLVDHLAIYSVSKDRKSRKEFTEISKALNSMTNDEENPRIRDRLLGNS